MQHGDRSPQRGEPAQRTPTRPGGEKQPVDRAAWIMDVALDLFAEKDYAAVSMKEIARTAGVTYSLLYYYFENKEALFHGAVQHAITEALHNYERIRQRHDNPVDLIDDWFNNNIQLSGTLRKLVKIMFDYSGPHGRPVSVERAINRFYEEERNIIATSIKEGISRGLFKAVDSERMAQFVSTHIDGIFFGLMIHAEFDLASAMSDLKGLLWKLLEYRGKESEVRPSLKV